MKIFENIEIMQFKFVLSTKLFQKFKNLNFSRKNYNNTFFVGCAMITLSYYG